MAEDDAALDDANIVDAPDANTPEASAVSKNEGMITHYGLFWSERDVFWGRSNSPGELLGRPTSPLGRRGAPTKEERKTAENFREYVGLYCLYRGSDLLYVGEAGLGTNRNLFDRLKQHRTGAMAGRWDHFSWFGRAAPLSGVAGLETALKQLEAVIIAITNPGHNRQNGTFQGAVQVFQIPHAKAEGDLDTKLASMSDEMAKMQKAILDALAKRSA